MDEDGAWRGRLAPGPEVVQDVAAPVVATSDVDDVHQQDHLYTVLTTWGAAVPRRRRVCCRNVVQRWHIVSEADGVYVVLLHWRFTCPARLGADRTTARALTR